MAFVAFRLVKSRDRRGGVGFPPRPVFGRECRALPGAHRCARRKRVRALAPTGCPTPNALVARIAALRRAFRPARPGLPVRPARCRARKPTCAAKARDGLSPTCCPAPQRPLQPAFQRSGARFGPRAPARTRGAGPLPRHILSALFSRLSYPRARKSDIMQLSKGVCIRSDGHA